VTAVPACYLVLGTPRSGTSMVAGILHHLGIPMGPRLLAADAWNPAGYYQDAEFEGLVVRGCRGGWPGWDEARADPWHAGVAAAVRGLAARRGEAAPVWGVKSNRLAFWLDSLASAADVRVLTTSRPRAASVRSWAERSGDQPGVAAGVIDRMAAAIAAALAASGLAPVLTVPYDAAVADPAGWVGRVAAAAGREPAPAAVAWVDAALRRFAAA
jgi:hypothetical protein